MADSAISRRRRYAGVCRVTREACCVRGWCRFECTFLQPELVAPIYRGLNHEFLGRITLRHLRLVTNAAAFFGHISRCPCRISELHGSRGILGYDVHMLVMGKRYDEIRCGGFTLRRSIE